MTKTTTLATSDTVDVPKNSSGTVQWGAVFSNFKRVTQEYEECLEVAPGYYTNCQSNKNAKADHLRYAYTEEFDHADFRVVLNKR